MTRTTNERSGVDAGPAFLFAFLCACPGATHRERWVLMNAVFVALCLLTIGAWRAMRIAKVRLCCGWSA